MPVHEPGKRLMHAVPLQFVAKKVAGGGHRPVGASLSLTSMIDFLFMVVVFLLISFGGSEATVAKGVTLPRAENTESMVEAPLIAVAGGQILVNGNLAGNTRSIEESDRLQRIDELFSVLKSTRELWKQVNPQKPFPGVAILQIDQDVKAIVVKSVFQTAAFAGYPNVSFMVQEIPKSGS